MAVLYYSKLFKSEPRSSSQLELGGFSPLSADRIAVLQIRLSEEDVWCAVKEMNPYKAPRPDRFQPIFFQRTWSVTGSKIVEMV